MGDFPTKITCYPVNNLDDNDFINIDELKECNLVKKNYVETDNSTVEVDINENDIDEDFDLTNIMFTSITKIVIVYTFYRLAILLI